MKVYARYFTENGLNFRLDTVLQFGNNWDIVGAAVLINPGSAKPIAEIDHETANHLSMVTGVKGNFPGCHNGTTYKDFQRVVRRKDPTTQWVYPAV